MEAVLGESGASMELVRKPVPMRRRVSAFQGERPSELWKEREREREIVRCVTSVMAIMLHALLLTLLVRRLQY